MCEALPAEDISQQEQDFFLRQTEAFGSAISNSGVIDV